MSREHGSQAGPAPGDPTAGRTRGYGEAIPSAKSEKVDAGSPAAARPHPPLVVGRTQRAVPALLSVVDSGTGIRLMRALQATGGNIAVQRYMGEWPEEPAGPAGPTQPLVLTPGPAPSAERRGTILERIQEILSNWWVGPVDEVDLGLLWSMFGEALPEVYDANKSLWDESIDRGMELSYLPLFSTARLALGYDVRDAAQEYLSKNLEDARAAETELGFEAEEARPTNEQVERRQELAWAAVQLEELRKVKVRLESIDVGFREVTAYDTGEWVTMIFPASFVPGSPPPIPHDDPRGSEAVRYAPLNVVPYDEVMEQWRPVTNALLSLADEHPLLFAALRENKLGQVTGEGAEDDPVGAMRSIMTNLKASIAETESNLQSGQLSWGELKPIHRQLLEGERAGRFRWDHPVFREMAKEVVGDYETGQTMADMSIGLAAAVMFIFATVATGGTAAVFLLAGLGVGAAQAASKWRDFDELRDAARSAASSRTELVGESQVDAALIEAVLETAFLALDAWGAGRMGLRMAAGAAARRAGARTASTEGLEGLATAFARGTAPDAAGRQLVERSVVEEGVETTMRRAGISDPTPLLRLVPEGSAAAARIAEFTALAARVGTEIDIPSVLRNIARETAERGVREADDMVALAVERLGPLRTLQLAGGWKNLASALGTDSAAGRRLLAWRDAIYRDLKQYVESDIRASVKETGTIGNFTNDLDMSFLGRGAAANRSKAVQFLAGRAGLSANAELLDKMLYIGVFTDPRRLHLFDRFPDFAQELSQKTASFEEQLIWNAELHRVLENPARHQRVRDAMRELGVGEIPNFQPLRERAVDVLSEQQDRLVAEIEQLAAAEAPDRTALRSKMLELANTQAQINVKEGGGYFSGGGVRRFVTEDPRSPFPGYGPGEAPPRIRSQDYTAALDQIGKLREATEKLSAAVIEGPAGRADIAASIKSIAKYGDRFVDAARAVGLRLPDPSVFDAMAGEFQRILGLARRQSGETLQAALRSDYGRLMAQVDAAIAQFDQVHVAVLRDLRVQAGIVGRDVVAADIVRATMTRYRWVRAKSMLRLEMGSVGRLIAEGMLDSDEGAPAPDVDQAAGTAPAPAVP